MTCDPKRKTIMSRIVKLLKALTGRDSAEAIREAERRKRAAEDEIRGRSRPKPRVQTGHPATA